VGQVSLDRVWLMEGAADRPGEPEPDALPEHSGGQVATAMLALARLGARTAYLGAVGDDPAADGVLAPLRRAGVDCSGVVRVAAGRTRRALIRVERRGGERAVYPERDPRVRLRPADLGRELLASARVVHVDAEDPEASAFAASLAQAAGAAVTLDADRLTPGSEALLPLADFPIVSARFAESLGDGSVRKALPELARRSRRMAVVTLGERGCVALAHGDGRVIESPGFRVEARDTTGAGDVFHAAFIWGLLYGLGAEAALRWANAAAALACQALGAQGGLPGRAEVEALLAARSDGAEDWR
jgi:sugar/nucleoside kinase (ribokinase family)